MSSWQKVRAAWQRLRQLQCGNRRGGGGGVTGKVALEPTEDFAVYQALGRAFLIIVVVLKLLLLLWTEHGLFFAVHG